MVVGVRFHERTPHILIMTDLFFATYGELVLLTKAWKMHGSLSYIVVNILIMIELAMHARVRARVRARFQARVGARAATRARARLGARARVGAW